jgi:hypothetical protein
MALLYHVNVTNPNNEDLLPPSLLNGPYFSTLNAAISAITVAKEEPDGSVYHIFENAAAFTAHINTISLTAEQMTALNEWKTANNITITYELFELNIPSDITIPHVFGD